jgi:hypothetical protein
MVCNPDQSFQKEAQADSLDCLSLVHLHWEMVGLSVLTLFVPKLCMTNSCYEKLCAHRPLQRVCYFHWAQPHGGTAHWIHPDAADSPTMLMCRLLAQERRPSNRKQRHASPCSPEISQNALESGCGCTAREHNTICTRLSSLAQWLGPEEG